MALISVASRIAREASGTMMRRTRCQQLAPSIIAASMISVVDRLDAGTA